MNKAETILLMDEDAETLEQLHTTLQREGYNVVAAVDGHAALRLAKTTQPDLIVSDLLLAGLDGFEVWKSLQMDKEFPNVPILVISSLAIPPRNVPWRPTPYTDWQLLNYSAFLPKPVDLRRFVRVVRSLLAGDQGQVIPAGPSIVVAMADNELQQTVVELLKQHDFGVEIADSLDRAMRVVRAVPPAALLLDYQSTDHHVKELAQNVKKFVPSTAVLMLVGARQEITLEVETCCDSFLSTPIHPTLTVASIERILSLHNLHRRAETMSNHLITSNRELAHTRQALLAQNEELAYTNAKLRELDSLKEMLTGMVVHDLKAPLGAVLGALNFLLISPKVQLVDNIRSLVNGAIAAGNQLLRLTETLLEVQRLREGRLKPDEEPFDIEQLIEICVQQIASLLTLHRLEAICTIPAELPLVYADPHISQRVLENLLDNAIKFAPANSTINITTSIAGDSILISVADQGPGIPKEMQTEIFNRFVQVQRPDGHTGRAGFGLGLSFCQMAIESMGGSIWVESDGQSGTTFFFTLPIHNEIEPKSET